MWIGIISTIIAMIMLVWAVNLWLLGRFCANLSGVEISIAFSTKNGFIGFCSGFMSSIFATLIALFLLICAVIGAIHCAFGTQGDIAFGEGGFIYRYALSGANELYTYSAGLVCVSVALLIIGIVGNVERFKHYCFALLCFVALKVFFVDTNSFSSLGKVALFVFMGVAFIGIAALYNRFVLKRESR